MISHLDELSGNVEKQLLIGGMLGDSTVRKQQNKYLIFRIKHTDKVADFVYWKKDNLPSFDVTVGREIREGREGGYQYSPNTKNQTYLHVCKQHPIFAKIRKLFYGLNENSVKKGIMVYHKCKLPYTFVDELDLLGLLIWYLDDGNRSPNTRFYGTISVKTLPNHSLTRLINRFNREYDLNMRLTNGGDTVSIPKKSMQKLLPIWNKMADDFGIPDSIRYKLRPDGRAKVAA